MTCDDAKRNLRSILDEANIALSLDNAPASLSRMCLPLAQSRDLARSQNWITDFKTICRQHPLFDRLLEDPYTRRAYEKPRGYAGDPLMLDFVFSGEPPENTSAIGQAVFRATTRLPNGLSIIHRRALLARFIDRAAEEKTNPSVFAIACGHLCEAVASAAFQDNRITDFLAIDRDEQSIEYLRRQFASSSVRATCVPLPTLLARNLGERRFDLVYSAGLLDYLSDRLATRLTASLWNSVAPMGTLLLCNFTTDSFGRGYMEAFMDWDLLYRDESQMKSLVRRLPVSSIQSTDIFRDPHQNIVYLAIRKAG